MLFKKYLYLSMVMSAVWAVPGHGESPSPKPSAEVEPVVEAMFAGGCFWCMEPPFESLGGVDSVISGYAGGNIKDPTYEQVSSGVTGHREVVKLRFKPKQISYQKLVEIFFQNVDPTDAGGQFVDRGFQYSTAIYVYNSEQRQIAEAVKKRLSESKRFKSEIVTPILDAVDFYAAEEYHQDYYKRNPLRYKYYRLGSGRDRFIDRHWPDLK
jgi:methionine-S-sulfoxide reductase